MAVASGSFPHVNLHTSIQITPSNASENQQNGVQFYDDFTTDQSLKVGLWKVDGPVAHEIAGRFTLVDPTLTFEGTGPPCGFVQTCPQGMGVSGVSFAYELAAIETTLIFTPPFTAEAAVMTTMAHGSPFALELVSERAGVIMYIDLNGVWYQSNSMSGPNQLLANPTFNTWYLLTAAIDRFGAANLTLAHAPPSNPNQLGIDGFGFGVLGSATGLRLAGGQYHLLLEQVEGLPPGGEGPNQAYWLWVRVSSSSVSPITLTTTSISRLATSTTVSEFSAITTTTVTTLIPITPLSPTLYIIVPIVLSIFLLILIVGRLAKKLQHN